MPDHPACQHSLWPDDNQQHDDRKNQSESQSLKQKNRIVRLSCDARNAVWVEQSSDDIPEEKDSQRAGKTSNASLHSGLTTNRPHISGKIIRHKRRLILDKVLVNKFFCHG